MAFSEFFADIATGANVNAGDDKTVVTSTNGAWSTVTNIFTATGGTPFSGVVAGDFASLYLDGGTVSVYVARVTSVGGGGLTLTLSATAKSGTAPTTAGVGITCTTGGKWKGPNAAENFPFGFVQSTMTNSSANPPRVNIKSGTYSITAGITHANNGPICFQGYTSAAGDGGKATIDGGTTNAILLTTSCTNCIFRDLIVQNNATGSVVGISSTGAENHFIRCVVNNVRQSGFNFGANYVTCIECEVYACNLANTSGHAGFLMLNVFGTCIRCIAHDNTGSNSVGFLIAASGVCVDCIADTNGNQGFLISGTVSGVLINCDVYNNTSDGIRLSGTTPIISIENCNLVKNGGYGINRSASTGNIYVSNCGFGAGTQANSSGTTNFAAGDAVTEEGFVTYADDVTPWVDPANGDFRINLAAAINAGRGSFTETAPGYTGTIGYPDIGAAQHLESTPVSTQIMGIKVFRVGR